MPAPTVCTVPQPRGHNQMSKRELIACVLNREWLSRLRWQMKASFLHIILRCMEGHSRASRAHRLLCYLARQIEDSPSNHILKVFRYLQKWVSQHPIFISGFVVCMHKSGSLSPSSLIQHGPVYTCVGVQPTLSLQSTFCPPPSSVMTVILWNSFKEYESYLQHLEVIIVTNIQLGLVKIANTPQQCGICPVLRARSVWSCRFGHVSRGVMHLSVPWKAVLHLGREWGEGGNVGECEGEVCVRQVSGLGKHEAINPFQHWKLWCHRDQK